jgi:hypothetical protein
MQIWFARLRSTAWVDCEQGCSNAKKDSALSNKQTGKGNTFQAAATNK